MKNIINRIKEWYRGKYIPPPENDPDSPIVIISSGYYKQPFLAEVLKQIGRFWINHWQWILVFLVGVAGLIVAIIKLMEG
jgi:hypothetical protein